jgi:hypothetical protein
MIIFVETGAARGSRGYEQEERETGVVTFVRVYIGAIYPRISSSTKTTFLLKGRMSTEVPAARSGTIATLQNALIPVLPAERPSYTFAR